MLLLTSNQSYLFFLNHPCLFLCSSSDDWCDMDGASVRIRGAPAACGSFLLTSMNMSTPTATARPAIGANNHKGESLFASVFPQGESRMRPIRIMTSTDQALLSRIAQTGGMHQVKITKQQWIAMSTKHTRPTTRYRGSSMGRTRNS